MEGRSPRCSPSLRTFANSFSLAGFHQCVISGDPHYRTFDNFVHHFQGRCTYTLTRTMGRVPEGLEPLSVAGRNHRRSVLHRVSFLREVYVEVLGFRVTLMQRRKMAVSSQEICLRDDAPREGGSSRPDCASFQLISVLGILDGLYSAMWMPPSQVHSATGLKRPMASDPPPPAAFLPLHVALGVLSFAPQLLPPASPQ